jgi:hypothetical protein
VPPLHNRPQVHVTVGASQMHFAVLKYVMKLELLAILDSTNMVTCMIPLAQVCHPHNPLRHLEHLAVQET